MRLVSWCFPLLISLCFFFVVLFFEDDVGCDWVGDDCDVYEQYADDDFEFGCCHWDSFAKG